jgi:hypothetical protein
MSTGVFTQSASTSIVGFTYNGNMTLPFSTFQGLYIGGSGVKTLSANTTVAQNFQIAGTSATVDGLECSTFDFSVTGTTTNSGLLSKNGAGSMVFVGLANFGNALNLTGNPSVEFRGGISINCSTFYTGTGTWTFTTNNQSVTGNISVNTFDCPILISGAITVTANRNANFQMKCLNTINGNNAASTFDNQTTLNYQNATRPMVTGVLQTNAAANTWIYGLNNQDIKGGTYRILTLNGTGVKTLQGNVIVATTYTLTAPATLNLNGFTRT